MKPLLWIIELLTRETRTSSSLISPPTRSQGSIVVSQKFLAESGLGLEGRLPCHHIYLWPAILVFGFDRREREPDFFFSHI